MTNEMTDDLQALPAKIGVPIIKARNVEEDLMDLLALHGTHPDRTRTSALLTRFHEHGARGLPEMERLACTVSTWWPQILAPITTGVRNAGSEGINRRARGHPTTHSSGAHVQPGHHPKPKCAARLG